MRGDVERAGEIVPPLTARGGAGWQSFAVHHDSIARVKRIHEKEVLNRGWLREDGVAIDWMHQTGEFDVVVVQPLAPKAFEVIVVGVSDVRVGVNRRAIAPVVVGVARAIGGTESDE